MSPPNERGPRRGPEPTSAETVSRGYTTRDSRSDESRFCPTCGSPWLYRLGECAHERHAMPALVLVRVGRRTVWAELDRLKGVA
jgi:hypothetical protein